MTESTSRSSAGPSALQQAGAAIKDESREIAGEAKAAAHKLAGDQRDALAEYVTALASAANCGADDLQESGYGRSAAMVRRTAGEVAGFAENLQQRAPGDIWEDVEGFARDHPVLVFGAGFALAFGATRFLKSGSPGAAEEDGAGEDGARGGAAD